MGLWCLSICVKYNLVEKFYPTKIQNQLDMGKLFLKQQYLVIFRYCYWFIWYWIDDLSRCYIIRLHIFLRFYLFVKYVNSNHKLSTFTYLRSPDCLREPLIIGYEVYIHSQHTKMKQTMSFNSTIWWLANSTAVSYTHLTLPTITEV